MNIYATSKENFITSENPQKVFRELCNLCLLLKNESVNYYCYCHRLRSKTVKCGLCKFSDALDDKCYDKFLLTHRQDLDKLKEIAETYWKFIQNIRKEDASALDFFNKNYSWNFRDYRQGLDLHCDLDQIIEHNEELITSNGLEFFFQHYV